MLWYKSFHSSTVGVRNPSFARLATTERCAARRASVCANDKSNSLAASVNSGGNVSGSGLGGATSAPRSRYSNEALIAFAILRRFCELRFLFPVSASLRNPLLMPVRSDNTSRVIFLFSRNLRILLPTVSMLIFSANSIRSARTKSDNVLYCELLFACDMVNVLTHPGSERI